MKPQARYDPFLSLRLRPNLTWSVRIIIRRGYILLFQCLRSPPRIKPPPNAPSRHNLSHLFAASFPLPFHSRFFFLLWYSLRVAVERSASDLRAAAQRWTHRNPMLDITGPQLWNGGLRAAAAVEMELAVPKNFDHGEPQCRFRGCAWAMGGRGGEALEVGSVPRHQGAEEVRKIQASPRGMLIDSMILARMIENILCQRRIEVIKDMHDWLVLGVVIGN